MEDSLSTLLWSWARFRKRQATANPAGNGYHLGKWSRVVDSRQVQNLALNGRNYMQLVTLVPGAAILDEDQLALTTSLSISQAAINGNRPNYNSLSVDGGFNMDSGQQQQPDQQRGASTSSRK